MKLRNNNTLGKSAKTIALFLGASALSLTSCRDNDFDWNEHYNQNVEHAYAEIIESVFGEIGPDFSWDLSGSYAEFENFGYGNSVGTRAGGVNVERSTDYLTIADGDNHAVLDWIIANLKEGIPHTDKGSTEFNLVVADNTNGEFSIAPIFQGSSICWDFFVKIVDKDGEILYEGDIFSKGYTGNNGSKENTLDIEVHCLKCGGTHKLTNFFNFKNKSTSGNTYLSGNGEAGVLTDSYGSSLAILDRVNYKDDIDNLIWCAGGNKGFLRIQEYGTDLNEAIDWASVIKAITNSGNLIVSTPYVGNEDLYVYKDGNAVKGLRRSYAENYYPNGVKKAELSYNAYNSFPFYEMGANCTMSNNSIRLSGKTDYRQFYLLDQLQGEQYNWEDKKVSLENNKYYAAKLRIKSNQDKNLKLKIQTGFNNNQAQNYHEKQFSVKNDNNYQDYIVVFDEKFVQGSYSVILEVGDASGLDLYVQSISVEECDIPKDRNTFKWDITPIVPGPQSTAITDLNTFLSKDKNYSVFGTNKNNLTIFDDSKSVVCPYCTEDNPWVKLSKYENAQYTNALRSHEVKFSNIPGGAKVSFYIKNTCGHKDDYDANKGHMTCTVNPNEDVKIESLLNFTDETLLKSLYRTLELNGITAEGGMQFSLFGLEDNNATNSSSYDWSGSIDGITWNKTLLNGYRWTPSDKDYNDLIFLYKGNLMAKTNKPDKEVEQKTISKRYMVEDLGYGADAQSVNASDIDFNDIVVDFEGTYSVETTYTLNNGERVPGSGRVTKIDPLGSTKVTIWAMGGTLDFDLMVGNTKVFYKEGWSSSPSGVNVSNVSVTSSPFGSTISSKKMYNTIENQTDLKFSQDVVGGYDRSAYITRFNIANNLWDPSSNNVHFVITEKNSDKNFGNGDGTGLESTLINFPDNGTKNPRIIAFPIGKAWQYERQSITSDWGTSNSNNEKLPEVTPSGN